jgi:hypothetical protein
VAQWLQGRDTLRQHGPETVKAATENAEPYPIDGLHEIGPETLLALRHSPPRLITGTRATDAIIRLPGEGGQLIVVTGIPNHGKSSWVTDAPREVEDFISNRYGLVCLHAALQGDLVGETPTAEEAKEVRCAQKWFLDEHDWHED